MNTITLSEGAGGRASRELEESFIFPLLGGSGVNGNDASVLFSGRIAVSTDSFVVSPLFFPEKSIGALAAAGSINDVLTCGAAPRYLTCSLIIEEGFSKDSLKRILADLRSEADRAGVTVAAGDTKVVPRGQCDGLYINTACIGLLEREPLSPQNISPGDAIIVTGYLGEHESALIIGRNGLDVKGIVSDCAGLSGLI
ncbi:MAG: hydrogenase expression/formation protein HypE, partial [Abditibacteriota bacterium]|nr:hydrogenase expression/formation protein HypE [Abditibacteriota bacterium]